MPATLRPVLLASAVAAGIFSATAQAQATDGVVASIKPVHSLVAAVMEGVGTPTLIVRGAGSEHAHALRPSDAEALASAKVVFRVGESMETYLNAPLKSLAGGARIVALEDAPGIEKLEFREDGPFEAHSSADDGAHAGHDDHAHDKHDAHAGEAHSHDDNGHDHEGHDHAGHDRGEHDLHIWLDPLNARALVNEIARVLGLVDPDNAMRYRANAVAYVGRLDALVAEVEATVAPVKDKPVVVFHDAYQYFEKRFGVNVVGSITVNPDVMPGAQRLSQIRDRVRELDAGCVFSEPQFEPKLVSVVLEGTGAKSGILDPLGAGIADGPDLYPQLIRNLADSLVACLSDAG